MKIALLGYGKMGKEIEKLALEKGHSMILKVDVDNAANFLISDLTKADAAIEFSTPNSVYNNIMKCFETNVPVVVGTTGWFDKLEEVKKICKEKNQTIFYSSNYSIGVNIFFELNKKLAQMMNKQNNYDVAIEEIHHTQKLDAPSGTAIALANDIIQNFDKKKQWQLAVDRQQLENKIQNQSDKILITAIRKENIPGTHTIKYESSVDSIEIKHTAHNRKGFAVGALMAAEWIVGKKGTFGMQDLLKL